MAWTAPRTWAAGEVLTAALLNTHLRDNLGALSTHVHSGAAGDGGSSLGPMVKATFTDAAAPSAPSAGQTSIFTTSGRVGARANGGAAKTLVDQDTAESLSNKTLVTPTIASFTNAQHDHEDAAGGGTLVGLPFVTRKTADETVNNSSSLQDDDHFSFAIGANETWLVDMWLTVTGFGGTPTPASFNCTWLLPTGGTKTLFGFATATQIGEGFSSSAAHASSSTGNLSFSSAINTFVLIHLHCVLKNGANAGTAQFQWAQGTAVAQNSQVLADSYMVRHKLT